MSLRSFLPFIVFAAVSGAAWQWAALAALVIGVRLLIQDRQAGTPHDALLLPYSNCAYFAALSAVAFAAPHSDLKHYCGALSTAWIGATMGATFVVHKPFTLAIARAKAPREVWNAPWFLRMNAVLTSVWAVSFLLAAAAIALAVLTHAGTFVQVAFQLLGFGVPLVFTKQYPKIVRGRLANASTDTTAPAAPAAPAL